MQSLACARAALKRCVSRTYATDISPSPLRGDRVVIGMSGGIDSAVAAKLLAAQDYDLSAVFMRNWDTRDEYGDSNKGCEWEKDWDDVQKACKVFDIPCQLIDLSKEYWNRVFEPSLRQWEEGVTPNPDVWCNREIKFGALLQRLPHGLNEEKPPWLATGHYARKDWAGSRPRLLRAVDPLKDQSYYLSSIPETGLARALFPLGNLTKAEVRRIAQDGGVPTSILERKESMGLCFIGQKKRTDFKEFIVSYLGTSPGPVKDLSTGQTLMKHRGLWQFTIGENLRLGGLREKMYVAQKDIPSNTIFVAPTSDPSLECKRVRTTNFSWIWAESSPQGLEQGKKLSVKVRHQMSPIDCTAKTVDDCLEITFDEPQKAVSAGQVAALWDGEWCLGCGIIADTS